MDSMIETLYVNKGLYSTLFFPVCAKYKLTMTEMLVLLFLSQNTQYDTASDIVEKLKITKSHVSASVRDLEERGYLRGSYAGRNHRTIHLRLCGGADEIVQAGKAVQQQFLSVIGRGFTDEELRTLGCYIRRINENAKDYLQSKLFTERS